MGDLVRFMSPKREKMYIRAAQNIKETVYSEVSENGRNVHRDDVTIALARATYECFYAMHDAGCPPSGVCEEIDWLLETLQKNLPRVKKNIWRMSRERKND